MNKLIITSLVFSSLLVSCGQKKEAPSNANSLDYNSIVLGKFEDTKDYNSTFDESKLQDLPRIVDLKEIMSPVKNQSNRGTCTYFTTAALIEAAAKKDLNKDINISEEYISYSAKSVGYFANQEGSTVYHNLTAINKNGVMLERDWSYQPLWFAKGLPCESYTFSNAIPECYLHYTPDEESKTKIIKSDGLTWGSFAKNTNDIIRFLATEKRPLSVSVTINFKGWPKTGDVYYNEELRKDCVANGGCGGHAVTLTGYDLDKKVFFFKNSWGSGWGHNGFGTMTFETVDRYTEKSLQYVKLDDRFTLPEDFNKDYLNVENFESSVTFNGALDISVATKVDHARGRSFLINSYIFKKAKDGLEANDTNVSLVTLPKEDMDANGGDKNAKAFKHIMVKDTAELDLTNENTLAMSIPESTLALPTVKNLLNSTENDAILRNDLYIHTDDQTFKLLSRNYKPLVK